MTFQWWRTISFANVNVADRRHRASTIFDEVRLVLAVTDLSVFLLILQSYDESVWSLSACFYPHSDVFWATHTHDGFLPDDAAPFILKTHISIDITLLGCFFTCYWLGVVGGSPMNLCCSTLVSAFESLQPSFRAGGIWSTARQLWANVSKLT